MGSLFPPYLDENSVDQGPDGPVRFAGKLLVSMHCAAPGFIPDHNYGPLMAESVRNLQHRRLHLTGDAVDGNLGPGTRAALKKEIGIDLDAIERGEGGEVMYKSPNTAELVAWPISGQSSKAREPYPGGCKG